MKFNIILSILCLIAMTRTFCLANQEEKNNMVSINIYISCFNLSAFFERTYNRIKFEANSMVRSVIGKFAKKAERSK